MAVGWVPGERSGSVEELEERARVLADEGKIDEALDALRQAIQLAPNAESPCNEAVSLLIALNRPDVAVQWMQDVAAQNPGEVWPWSLCAQACAAIIERDRSPNDDEVTGAVDRALMVRQLPDVKIAMDLVRGLIRKAGLWNELARHIETQMQHTLKIGEQIALHDELAEVLAARLSDPLAAREIRNRCEQFRDVPSLVATYWKTLEENPDNAEIWNEAEAFFRANELREDLATLLHHSVEGASTPQKVELFDELFQIYVLMADPPWERLLGAIEHAISNAEPGGLASLEARRQRVREQIDEVTKPRPAPALATSMHPAVLFVAAAALGVGLVAVAIAYLQR